MYKLRSNYLRSYNYLRLNKIYAVVFYLVYYMTPIWVIDIFGLDSRIANGKYSPIVGSNDDPQFSTILFAVSSLGCWILHGIMYMIFLSLVFKTDFKNNGPIEISYHEKTPISLKVYEFDDICYEYNQALRNNESFSYIVKSFFSFKLYNYINCTRSADYYEYTLLAYPQFESLSASELSKELSKIDPRSFYKKQETILPQPSF